jgi:hypothetical protein
MHSQKPFIAIYDPCLGERHDRAIATIDLIAAAQRVDRLADLLTVCAADG